MEFSEQIVGKVEIELENIGPADECEPGVSRGCVQHPGETRVLSSLGIGPLFFSIIGLRLTPLSAGSLVFVWPYLWDGK